MNTPAHILLGTAAFARPGDRRVTIAAILGAVAPDLSLYIMAGTALYVLGYPGSVVFRELYYSDAWQQVFAIDNSFILWGFGLAFAVWARRPAVTAFAAAGLLHLACDFPLHNHDARMHFWPVSDWVFESPLSYWDRRHHGQAVGLAETGLAIACTVFLLWRFTGLRMRAFVLVLFAAEMMANDIWRYIF